MAAFIAVPALILGIFVVVCHVSPRKESPEELLYREAFEQVRDHHQALQDPDVRRKWVSQWEHRFDGSPLLTSKEGTDDAIEQMLKSLNAPFDHYYRPEKKKVVSSVRAPQLTILRAQQSPTVQEPTMNQQSPPAVQMPSVQPSLPAVQTPPAVPTPPPQPPQPTPPAVQPPPAQQAPPVQPAAPAPQLPVSVIVLPDDVYIIRITEFDMEGRTFILLKHLLTRIRNCKALIIDLKSNGGGNVWNTLQCLELFIENGRVLTTRGRSGDVIEETQYVLSPDSLRMENFAVQPDGRLSLRHHTEGERQELLVDPSVPIAILTDGDTASSAELFTAAMRRFRQAHIVGRRTFGKGVYQSLHGLDSERVLAYTAGEFRIDDVHRIHGVGISPDETPDAKMVKEKGANADALLAFTWILKYQYESADAAKLAATRNWGLPAGNGWLIGPATPNQAGSNFLRPEVFLWLFFAANITFVTYLGFRVWVELHNKSRRQRLVRSLEKANRLRKLAAHCNRLAGKDVSSTEFVPKAELLAELEELLDDGKTPVDAATAVVETAVKGVQTTFNKLGAAAKTKALQLLKAVDARLDVLLKANCNEPDIAQAVSLSDTARMLIEDGNSSGGKDGTVYVNAWAHALEALRLLKQIPLMLDPAV